MSIGSTPSQVCYCSTSSGNYKAEQLGSGKLDLRVPDQRVYRVEALALKFLAIARAKYSQALYIRWLADCPTDQHDRQLDGSWSLVNIDHKLTLTNGPSLLGMEEEDIGNLLSDWVRQTGLKKNEGQAAYKLDLYFAQMTKVDIMSSAIKPEVDVAEETKPRSKGKGKAVPQAASNVRPPKSTVAVKTESKDAKVKLEKCIKRDPDTLLYDDSADDGSTTSIDTLFENRAVSRAHTFPDVVSKAGWLPKSFPSKSAPSEGRPVTPPTSGLSKMVYSPPSPLAMRSAPKRRVVRVLPTNDYLSKNLGTMLSKQEPGGQLHWKHTEISDLS